MNVHPYMDNKWRIWVLFTKLFDSIVFYVNIFAMLLRDTHVDVSVCIRVLRQSFSE